jgi:hypothetical protein
MHTSRLTAILFVVAIAFAALAQVTNYCGTPIGQRTFLQKIALLTAYSADPDQPFRPIAITDSGDPDHAVHYA